MRVRVHDDARRVHFRGDVLHLHRRAIRDPHRIGLVALLDGREADEDFVHRHLTVLVVDGLRFLDRRLADFVLEAVRVDEEDAHGQSPIPSAL